MAPTRSRSAIGNIVSQVLPTLHVFGVDYGPVVFLQPVHLTLEILGPSVVVKRDDVGFAKLNLLRFAEICSIRRRVCRSDSAGERLCGIHRASPTRTLAAKAQSFGRVCL
jgi:hypothetical protein